MRGFRGVFCLTRPVNPDVLLDNHIGRPADQDQMFDIIAPHENQTPTGIHRRCVHDGQPQMPSPAATDKGAAQKFAGNKDQQQHAKNDCGEQNNKGNSWRQAQAEQIVDPVCHRTPRFDELPGGQ